MGVGGFAEEISLQASRGSPPFSFHSVIIKCVVQLELVEAVENVLLQRTLSESKISHGEVECEQDPKVCFAPAHARYRCVCLAVVASKPDAHSPVRTERRLVSLLVFLLFCARM